MNVWSQKKHYSRVVLAYKKGDSSKITIYRLISLLNSMYKVFAAIVHKRVAERLDIRLPRTQFGFRKGKDTADAKQCLRKTADHGEQTNTKTILILLAWEKHSTK